ncbi:hypothetical protein B0T21DRAFT_416918 [Apiosordaria backusii]|uniref:Uncharacterized protein n=1 Tax=Apiosordaria backusii TaxID=314023 RepID=A0AA39ZS06_9PEZI|nr:hypothetical protein B0T21DRAFT_416918 [Apiosordaria backusii]
MKYFGHLWTVLSLLCFAGLGLCLGPYNPPSMYHYWIHESCYQKQPDFNVFMDEVFYEARSAANRLRDPTDVDFATVFWATFKVTVQDQSLHDVGYEARRLWGGDYSRTAYDTVVQAMECLAYDWDRTLDITQANVQIWCDNGDRYQKHGPRSWDPVNSVWIDSPGDWAHSCQDFDGGNQVYAETNPHFTRRADRPAWFYDITICDGVWEDLRNIDDLFGNTVPRTPGLLHASAHNDLTSFGRGIGNIEWFFPHLTIMHEFFHVLPWAFMDPQGPGLEQRVDGWSHTIATTTDQALSDPEAYTMLGLWAALADLPPTAGEGAASRGGYTISREWSLLQDTEKFQNPLAGLNRPNLGVEGIMVAYRDITGVRSLR